MDILTQKRRYLVHEIIAGITSTKVGREARNINMHVNNYAENDNLYKN